MPGVSGGWDVDFKTAQLIAQMQRQVIPALTAGGLEIIRVTRPIVPKDTGELANSASVLVENDNSVTINYSADHAAIVHEDLEAHHTNGEAKYLDKGIKRGSASASRKVSQVLGQALR